MKKTTKPFGLHSLKPKQDYEDFMEKTCCDKCIKLFGVMGCKGKSSCQCHQGKEWLESRKNIHALLKEMLAGEKIKAGELPQIIVDAVDSAFIAGLEANPDAKLIQQNIAVRIIDDLNKIIDKYQKR